jgi:dihydrofolate reductase
VTEGIEAAVARAREIAGSGTVGVAAGTIAGQALAAGLIDEVAIDLVPIVMGGGHRYFEDVDPAAVKLGDPTVVIPTTRVTHLRFPVLR